MWKRIRNTILILLLGSAIGVALGMHGGGKRDAAGSTRDAAGASADVSVSGEQVSDALAAGGSSAAWTLTPSGAERVQGAYTGAYAEPTATEEAPGSYSRSELDAAREAIGMSDAAVAARMDELSRQGYYYYDMMDPGRHLLYTELLMILEAHADGIRISTTDADELASVFQCVFCDHPELYYFDGYRYSRYSRLGGEDDCFTFGARYTYTAEECAALEPQIEHSAQIGLSGIPEGASEYERVKHVYEYVIAHTDYDETARDNQNILSVLLYGRSVCQGYAKAVQYLLGRAGVRCSLVVGDVYGGSEGHAWNLVNIDGAYYYLDATWGDAAYLMSHGEDVAGREEISYSYLNVTSEELGRTHRIRSEVPMPYCVATEANYYVREGLYFAGYDEEALRSLFEGAVADGSRTLSIKLSSDALYQSFLTRLLEEQEIFALLPEAVESVEYSEGAQLRVLSFWF